MSVDSSPDFDKISTCDPIFRKNGYVKSQWEKIFEIEIFVSKYVLDHSESIPTKKIFSTKNFCLCHFLTCDPIFRKKGCQVTMGKIFEFEIFVLKYVLDHSESILKKKFFFDQKFLSLTFFDPKMAKNRGFLKIFGRKKFFFKKIFVPSLRTFIAVLLSHHTHVYL